MTTREVNALKPGDLIKWKPGTMNAGRTVIVAKVIPSDSAPDFLPVASLEIQDSRFPDGSCYVDHSQFTRV